MDVSWRSHYSDNPSLSSKLKTTSLMFLDAPDGGSGWRHHLLRFSRLQTYSSLVPIYIRLDTPTFFSIFLCSPPGSIFFLHFPRIVLTWIPLKTARCSLVDITIIMRSMTAHTCNRRFLVLCALSLVPWKKSWEENGSASPACQDSTSATSPGQDSDHARRSNTM
jgi:hypothetical protein